MQDHRKLTDKSDVLEEDNEEKSETEEENTDTDEDEENVSENEEESHHSEPALEDPVNGPMIDSALIPTQAMLASANPYLNPMHPLHPFKHEFNVKHHYNTPHGMVTYSNGSSDHGSSGGMGGMGSMGGMGGMGGMNLGRDDLASFDKMMGLPNEIYPDRCSKVQSEAMKIANKLMKDYNKRVFRKIMTYLLKSKFLIGMTEIKLNHIMRKKISNVMNSFSKVSGGNIEFVHSSQEPVLSDEDDSMDSDVQDIDFSGFSDSQVEKGSDTEMFNNLNSQMGTQANVHLDD